MHILENEKGRLIRKKGIHMAEIRDFFKALTKVSGPKEVINEVKKGAVSK